jgi:hypothetical protein
MGRLNGYQLLRLLKNAVSLSPTLHSVQLTDNYEQQRGQFPLDYVQYKELLYAAADNLDGLKPPSRDTSRKAHKAEFDIAEDYHEPEDEGAPGETNQDPLDIIMANVARQGSFRPSMKREVWKKLSKEGQETWDKLSNDDKANILGYVNKKLEAKSDGKRAAFITEVLIQAQDKEDDDDKKVKEQDEEQESMRLINTLVMKNNESKVKEAHPGDIRRVLASKKGKGERKVNMASFVWVTERSTEQNNSDSESDGYDSEDEEPPALMGRATYSSDKESSDNDIIISTRGPRPTYSDSDNDEVPKRIPKSK